MGVCTTWASTTWYIYIYIIIYIYILLNISPYCEYILRSTGISIYTFLFFALNTIEYIYVLFNIPLAYMI